MNMNVLDVPRVQPETRIAAACAARAALVDPVEIFMSMRGSKPAALARCIAIHLVYERGFSARETGSQFGRSPGAVRSANDGIVLRCKSPRFGMAMTKIQNVYHELLRRHLAGELVECAGVQIVGKMS